MIARYEKFKDALKHFRSDKKTLSIVIEYNGKQNSAYHVGPDSETYLLGDHDVIRETMDALTACGFMTREEAKHELKEKVLAFPGESIRNLYIKMWYHD